MLSNANFLILDEPTNHLDITSKEILEQALNQYTGTVLYVSHDRYFINQTATRILDLVNETFVNYIGNYDYYLEKRTNSPLRCTAGKSTEETPAETSETKVSWQQQKEEQARRRKRENELKRVESEITALEKRSSEIDEKLILPDVATDPAKCIELSSEQADISLRLEDLYEQWEMLAE